MHKYKAIISCWILLHYSKEMINLDSVLIVQAKPVVLPLSSNYLNKKIISVRSCALSCKVKVSDERFCHTNNTGKLKFKSFGRKYFCIRTIKTSKKAIWMNILLSLMCFELKYNYF